MKLSTSDLILIHNLLRADAKFHDGFMPQIAADRRSLAERLKAEVEARDNAMLKTAASEVGEDVEMP